MTKHLENTLNLPHLDDILAEALGKTKAEATESVESLHDEPNEPALEEPAATTPTVDYEAQKAQMTELAQKFRMLDGSDHTRSMDELYRETLAHGRNIMDLGFNVPPPNAASIFEQGASMYKNAMDAKDRKRDAELKLMKLMLDQRKLELEEQKMKMKAEKEEPKPNLDAEVTIVENRNDLIKRIREQMKSEKP